MDGITVVRLFLLHGAAQTKPWCKGNRRNTTIISEVAMRNW